MERAILYTLILMGIIGALAVVALVAVLWFHRARPEEVSAFVYRLCSDEDGHKVHAPAAGLIEQLRHRAMLARREANGFLAVLFFTIASGTMIYASASWISEIELRGPEKTFESALAVVKQRVVNQAVWKKTPLSLSEIEDLKHKLDLIEGANQTAHQAVKKDVEAEQQRRFLTALSTRIGAVLMLFFLAQFLINGYRYAARLAAAYNARADALLLGWSDADAAKRFASVEEINFDKGGRAPTKEALELAKQLNTRQPAN